MINMERRKDSGRLAGVGEVAELLGGISRARAYLITRDFSFPEPLGVINAKGGRPQPIWWTKDVKRWIEQNRPDKVTW